MEFDKAAGEEQSDFTDSEKSTGKEKREKILLGSSKKKDKEKKKEKETRYNQLGAESSGEEDEGKKKKKAFKLGALAKKDKKEKKDKDKDSESKEVKEGKKKEKKEKPKLKLKKSHKGSSEPDGGGGGGSQAPESSRLPPVFGVALEVAVERSRCHDGINLPVVVRECVDYIEAEGLTVEGIYRSSGVKSKITKLKAAYNTRQTVKLASYEPAVVASLLKLFLRELPEPVLTLRLATRFEEVSQLKVYSDRRDGMIQLLAELPDCNRLLVQWVFVHMGHVIANEKMNKMTLQNVSIVLSPTMRISHRVLNCIFEHHVALFTNVKLKRYIPPISVISNLPDSPRAIEEEMRKQESLLAELHAEISSGVVVGKAREEQLWEQQRIVTQLKRNLRHAKTNNRQPPAELLDYDEELNFALQSPGEESGVVTGVAGVSSPEEVADQEHRVTVQIHRDTRDTKDTNVNSNKNITVIKLSATQTTTSTSSTSSLPTVTPTVSVAAGSSTVTQSTSKVTSLPAVSVPTISTPASVPAITSTTPGSAPVVSPVKVSPSKATPTDAVDSSEAPEEAPQSQPTPQVVSFSSPILPKKAISVSQQQQQSNNTTSSKIPLLPPPPASSKPKTHKRTNSRSGALLPPTEQKLKSKSLPRGLPSDGSAFDQVEDSKEAQESPEVAEKTEKESPRKEALVLEELRLKYQYEELLTLKTELERKKRTERREISELEEEIATMQTLYQYRTYSVDSSEEDSENDLADTKEQRSSLLTLLSQLSREKRELEEKKVALQTRLAGEREACLKLRVNIRLEQERIKRQKLSQVPGIGFGKLNLMD